MNKRTMIPLICFLLTAVSLLPIAVQGQEMNTGNRQLELPAKLRELEKRQIYVYREPHFVNLHSVQESDKGDLWFDFSISSESDLEISMRYGGSDVDEKESQELLLRFMGLVEYRDLDENGRYDIYSDELVSNYPLSGSYYSSDLANRQGNFRELKRPEKVTDIVDQFEDFHFAEGYNYGFDLGFDRGYQKGYRDSENGMGPRPELEEHLEPWMIRKLFSIPWDSYKEDFDEYEQVEIPSRDAIFTYYKAYVMGLSSGFRKGYEVGYHIDEEATTRSQHGNDEEYAEDEMEREDLFHYDDLARYIPDELKEGVANSRPIFRDVNVERVDLDDESYEIKLSVMDSRNRFGISCTVVNEFSWVDNGYLSPGSLKVDLLINDFPYRQRDTDIALLMDTGMITDSTKDIDFNNEEDSYDESISIADDEEMIRISTDGFSGFFSWADWAMADGERVDVGYTDHPSFFGTEWESWEGHQEHFKGVIFSYPRANSIEHDPKLGFIEIEDKNIYEISSQEIKHILQGSIPVFLITSVLVAAAVAVTWKKRGR